MDGDQKLIVVMALILTVAAVIVFSLMIGCSREDQNNRAKQTLAETQLEATKIRAIARFNP